MKNLSPLFAVLGAALIGSPAIAQRTATFSFDSSLRIHSPSAFRYVKITDDRKYQDNLGMIRTGLFQAKSEIVTEGSFSDAFGSFANRCIDAGNAGQDTLQVILHDCKVEDINDNYISTFYFKAAFFLGGNDKYYLVKDIDSIYETQSGGSILMKNMGEKLFSYLGQVASSDPNAYRNATAFTSGEAIQVYKNRKSRYPVYSGAPFKQGVYYTIEAFYNNQPSLTEYVEVDRFPEQVNRPFFYLKNEKGKKGDRINKFFAVYNGRNWYLPNENGCVKFRFEDGDFYRHQYSAGMPIRRASAGGMGGMFGLVGALAVAGVEALERSRNLILYEARLNPADDKFYPVRRLE